MLKPLFWILLKILEIGLSLILIYSCWNFEQPKGILFELWGIPILFLIYAAIIKGWFKYLKFKHNEEIGKNWNPFTFNNFFLIASTSTITNHIIDALPEKTFFEYPSHLDGLYKLIFYIIISSILFIPKKYLKNWELSLIIISIYSSPIFSVPLDINKFAMLTFHAIIFLTLSYFIYEKFLSKNKQENFLFEKITLLRILPPLIVFLIISLLMTIFAVCRYNHIMEFLSFIDYLIVIILVSSIRDIKKVMILSGIFLFNLTIMIYGSFLKLVILSNELGVLQSLQYRLWIAQLHPNFTASYFLLFIPILFALFIFNQRNIWGNMVMILFIVLVFLLLLTYSKAAWIGLFLSFVPIIYFIGFKDFLITINSIFFKKKKIMTAIILILLLITIIPSPIKQRIKTRFFNKDDSIERLIFYETVLKGIKANSLTGVGLGNHFYMSKFAFDKLFTIDLWEKEEKFNISNKNVPKLSLNSFMWIKRWLNWGPRGSHSHNLFLEFAISTGIFSIFAILWFIFSHLKNTSDLKKLFSLKKNNFEKSNSTVILSKAILIGGFGSLIGILSCSMFDYPLGFICMGINLSFLLGFQIRIQSFLLYTFDSEIQKPRKVSSSKLPKLILFLIFIVIITILINFIIGPIIALKLSENSAQYNRKKMYKIVLPYIKYAVKFDPLNTKYHDDLGNLYMRLNDYDNAKKSYLDALNSNPHDAGILSKLGLLMWFNNNRNDSIIFFKKALLNDPVGIVNDEHFTNLALSMYNDPGNYSKCFYLLKTAISCNPFKVNDLFWVFPINENPDIIKVVSRAFREKSKSVKNSPIIFDFLQNRIKDSIKQKYSFIKEEFIIDELTRRSDELTYNNSIYLADIFDDIFKDYLNLKNEDPEKALDLLSILATGYEICGLSEKSSELMKMGNFKKLTFYDKKGNVIEKVSLKP